MALFYEIWELVIRLLRPKDLLPLSKTNKTLRLLCRPYLFKRITLLDKLYHPYTFQMLNDANNNKHRSFDNIHYGKLCKSIKHRQYLALYISTLHLILPQQNNKKYIVIIPQLLEKCVNLQFLLISCTFDTWFEGIPIDKLRHLYLCINDTGEYNEDEELIEWNEEGSVDFFERLSRKGILQTLSIDQCRYTIASNWANVLSSCPIASFFLNDISFEVLDPLFHILQPGNLVKLAINTFADIEDKGRFLEWIRSCAKLENLSIIGTGFKFEELVRALPTDNLKLVDIFTCEMSDDGNLNDKDIALLAELLPDVRIVNRKPRGFYNMQTIVPKFFHLCETNDLLLMVSEMLNRLILHNDSIPLTSSNLTRFHSRIPPQINVCDYLKRIVRYGTIEKSVLLLILIYVDRVCEVHKNFTISSLTCHRFLITTITVGSKSISDIYCTNSHYAKVGGITLLELNLLEIEFCTNMIQWNLAISAEVLQQYYQSLVRTSANFTITDND